MNPTPNQITECNDERLLCEWISVYDRTPMHSDKVKTKDALGREFDCQFFHWSPELKPYFKVIGKVWSHGNVTHWKPI